MKHQLIGYDGAAHWLGSAITLLWTDQMDQAVEWDESSSGAQPTVGCWVARLLLGPSNALFYRCCVLPPEAVPTTTRCAFGIGQLDPPQRAQFDALCHTIWSETGTIRQHVENLFMLQLFSLLKRVRESGHKARSVWLLMCYTPSHVRKMNYSKRDAFVKNHGVPTIAFLQQLLDGPIGQGRSMESVAMFDVIAAPCPDSKPTPEQKSIGPRVAKLIKEWLIDIDILERNAGVVCFGIVTHRSCGPLAKIRYDKMIWFNRSLLSW